MSFRNKTEGLAPALEGAAQFLVVRCGRTWLALAADIVRGIVEPAGAVGAEAATLPAMACPLTDLAAQLGLSSETPSPEARVVSCAIHERRRALLVDRVAGLCDVETNRIRPLPPHFTGSERRWITGLFLFQESVALVLDSGWLVGPEGTASGQAVIVEQAPRPVAESPESCDPGGSALVEDVVALTGTGLERVEFEEAGDAEDIPWADL